MSQTRPRLVGDRYQIEGQLGIGGMCIIYRGTQAGTDRPVAIKVLRPEFAGIPEVVARFENEARVTARLRSDHVVAILDAGRLENGESFIVYEYLDGADLRCVLDARGSLPVHEAVDYVVQACDALADAHALGIIHRDIKPENIVITRATDGTALVKVLDFGVAKSDLLERRCITHPGDALGSPQYMPPEQLIDPSSADPRSDIWALGIVLYELLTGSSPFERQSMPAVSAAVLTGRPPTPSELCDEVPRPLDAIVMRCLQKDPAGRFGDVGEFARALAPFGPPESETIATRTERILEYTSQRSPSRLSVVPSEDRVTLPAVSLSHRVKSVRRTPSVPIAVAFGLAGAIGALASVDARSDWTLRTWGAVQARVAPELRPTREPSSAPTPTFPFPRLAIAVGSAVPELEALPAPLPPTPPRWKKVRRAVGLDPTAVTESADAAPAPRATAELAGDVAKPHAALEPATTVNARPAALGHDAPDPANNARLPDNPYPE